MKARRPSEQGIVLALALAIFVASPQPGLWAPVVAYALAWLIVSVIEAARPGALRISLGRAQAAALVALVAVPAAAHAFRLFDRVLENEGLAAIDHVAGARLRLEDAPAIAPPLVAADRPQTFYVHAPDAREVAVRFGPDGARLEARALGHGVFRLEYDPRTHGPPDPPDGPLRATIITDAEPHERAMLAVSPLAHPRWLAPSPDRSLAASVSEETDALIIVDRRGLLRRVEVDDGPVDARFVSDRVIAVAHRYASTLAFVDAARGRVIRRREVGPLAHRMAVDAGRTRIALAHGGEAPHVSILDASGARLASIPLAYAPDHLAFGAADTLIASSVRPPALHHLRREGETWREDRPPLWLGRPAVTMTASADRRSVIVAVTDVQAEGPPHLGNHYVDDQLVTVDLTSWSIARRVRTARRTNRQESPGNVDRGVSPMGIDALEDGSLLVAFAGTDDVWRIGARDGFGDGEPTILGLDDHPLGAPHSAVALGDRVAVSSPSHGTIGIFDRDGRREALVRLAPSDRDLLRDGDERALQRRIGERTFYESTRAGVSCQACHLHGGSDGTRHNIGGLTLVATLDTRGLLGTPPYLRDGGYPRLGSLDELAQTLYRGFRRRQGGRRLSLERYLEALPRPLPPRQLEGRDEARERRGLDAFVRARCPLCHAPPAFTNLGQHPMEAIFPALRGHAGYELDTPSLLGLGQSAPYLVDGRAETLEAVFREHDPAGRHGDTRRLDARALSDLVYFLEGL